MKYVLVLYSIINGAPVEQGRVPDDIMTYVQCDAKAKWAANSIFGAQPELVGQIAIGCAPSQD